MTDDATVLDRLTLDALPRKRPPAVVKLDFDVFARRPAAGEPGALDAIEKCPAWRYLSMLPSRHSQQTMATQLRKGAKWMGAADWNQVEWALLGVKEISRLMSKAVSELDKGAKVGSVRLFFSALRGVCRESYLLGHLRSEDLVKIREISPPDQKNYKSLGRRVSRKERTQVFHSVASDKKPSIFARRDSAILAMMFYAGLRRSEAASLNTRNLSIESATLEFEGKGRKVRQVPLGEMVMTPLIEWLEVRGNWPGPLFCRLSRKGAVIKMSISSATIYRICQRYSGEQRFSPHDCRRTFATEFIQATRDIHSAKRVLGHEHPATTARYDMSDHEVDRDNMNFFSEKLGRDD